MLSAQLKWLPSDSQPQISDISLLSPSRQTSRLARLAFLLHALSLPQSEIINLHYYRDRIRLPFRMKLHKILNVAKRARIIDLMTINDAAGILTANRSDGHLQWPNDLMTNKRRYGPCLFVQVPFVRTAT